MDASSSLGVICACMAVGAYLPGVIALLMPSQMHSTSVTSAVSAGLLLGAGLCVIVPEGFETLQAAQAQTPVSEHLPGWAAGAALLAGFLLMSTLDAFRPTHAAHDEGCPGHMHHHHPAGHDHGYAAPHQMDGNHHWGTATQKLELHAPLLPHDSDSTHKAGALFEVAPLWSHGQLKPHQQVQVQQQEQAQQGEVVHQDGALQQPHAMQQVVLPAGVGPAVQVVQAVQAVQAVQHRPRCSHHHHRTAAGLHVCHHQHQHNNIQLHHVSISRQQGAPVCNHPPHAFPPSDCLLLPQCSWQPLQLDEECEREAPLSSGTSECSETIAPTALVQQLILEEDESQVGHNEGSHQHEDQSHHLGAQRMVARQQLHAQEEAVVLTMPDEPSTALLAQQPNHDAAPVTCGAAVHRHEPHEHHDHHHHHHGDGLHDHHHTYHHHVQSQHQPLQGVTEGRPVHANNGHAASRLSQNRRRDAQQALIGLLIHSSADGLAVGAAALANNLAVSLAIALSIMVHKLPVAYGLAAFLRAAGQSVQAAHAGLLAFVTAAPCTALVTYYIVGSFTWATNPQVVAMCLLASGGTVLHAGAVHVLPSAGTRLRQLCIMSLSCCVPLLIGAMVVDAS